MENKQNNETNKEFKTSSDNPKEEIEDVNKNIFMTFSKKRQSRKHNPFDKKQDSDE